MGVNQVIKPDHEFHVFGDREEFTLKATTFIREAIETRLSFAQTFKIALSGGSTPKPIYELLSKVKLNWSRVNSTLTDDRITDGPDGSNAEMVRNLLVQNAAAEMNFQPLQANSSFLSGFDLSILGMGTDGHTASWFPGSPDLREALNPNTGRDVMMFNAKGCPGAGSYPNRLTMTLPAVLNSQSILLLLTGEEKRRVFQDAVNKSVYEAPVKALLASGPRLTVMWAP